MALSDQSLIREIRRKAKEVGSVAEWARQHDFAPGFISDVLCGRRPISERLARALGYRPADGWVKVEGGEQ